jgi:hypothetical protein
MGVRAAETMTTGSFMAFLSDIQLDNYKTAEAGLHSAASDGIT